MMWFLVYITIVLLLLLCLVRVSKKDKYSNIPGPRGVPILRNALDFVMDPVPLFYYFRTLANTYKRLFKFEMGPRKFVAIYNPEDAEIIMSGTKHNSKGFLYNFIQPWLKEGLLLSNGSKWHQRRKLLTPAFHFRVLRIFNTILEENCQKFSRKLEAELVEEKTNISAYVAEFALQSICETAMGTKLDEESTDFSNSYKNGIHKFGHYVTYRALKIWMHPQTIFSLTNAGRKQKKILDIMRSFRDSVIDQRRESNEKGQLFLDVINGANDDDDDDDVYSTTRHKKLAMLDLLLQAEKDGIIDADGIGEEVDTFMFAGHDTTASALQMIFMLLANNMESQDRIVLECNTILGTSTRCPSIGDLSQMKFLEACIKEGLRLYPPVFLIIRNIREPTTLSQEDHEVPAGADCIISIYDLQRQSDQFCEPLKFRPERFLTENPTWHPYAYIPFSAGPRNCIGQRFAMIEMKLALIAVLRKYRVCPVTRPEDVVINMAFVLRPNHPIYVKFEKREECSGP